MGAPNAGAFRNRASAIYTSCGDLQRVFWAIVGQADQFQSINRQLPSEKYAEWRQYGLQKIRENARLGQGASRIYRRAAKIDRNGIDRQKTKAQVSARRLQICQNKRTFLIYKAPKLSNHYMKNTYTHYIKTYVIIQYDVFDVSLLISYFSD